MRVIGERQVKLLRTLAAETIDTRTIEEACCRSMTSLAQNPYDLPFAMLYLLDQDTQTVTLAGTAGIAKNHQAVLQSVALDTPTYWPFAEVLRTQQTCVVPQLGQTFDTLPTGAWKRPPSQAVAAPVAPSGQTGKAGVLIVGLNPFRLFDQSYQGFINLVAGQIAASLANAQAYENEVQAYIDRTGNRKLEENYYTFIYQPSYSAKSEIDGVIVFGFDVTEQIAARKRAEESEASFRTLAENIPNLAWVTTPDGWHYWYNSRWYEYAGTTPEQMQGWGWKTALDPQVVPVVQARWEECLRSGEPLEMTFPIKGIDGVARPFLVRSVPIRNDEGKIIHWFGTAIDITEQKMLEQQKDDFIGITSNELKNPVTSIKGYTQLLERRFRQTGDEQAVKLFGRMDAQLDKLTSLIGDLLDVTRLASRKLLFHPTSFDFNALVTEITEEIQRTTTKHRLVLDLAAPLTLTADRDRIGQVLTNLLTNAIKYSPSADTIRVKTVLDDEAVITSVQDYGIGIPKEKLPHIFERFYRVEGEPQLTYAGLGLGLYISAEFVKRHHGSIWVQSEAGKGTTFSFSLPLAYSQEAFSS